MTPWTARRITTSKDRRSIYRSLLMSLDVYLTIPGAKVRREGSGIFVRHAGSIREITREEWDAVNPGAEPFTAVRGAETGEVYSANITHGLWKMAYAAGIHEA